MRNLLELRGNWVVSMIDGNRNEDMPLALLVARY